MFSRILIKLIDQAILPAIVLFVTKILSVVLISSQLGIKYSYDVTGFVFPTTQDYLIVNSYSTLAMIVVVASGMLYVLVKSFLLHDSHIHPSLTAKLFEMRMSMFIQTSFDLYSQGAIWLSYSYLLLIISGVMAIFGLSLPWIFYVSLIFTIVSTTLLIIDVETEMDSDNKDGETEEEYVLKLTEDLFV